MPEKIAGAERMAIVDKLEEVKWNKNYAIIADCAGAVEIRDMRKYGYNVRRSKKGTGSVIAGISQVRGYELFITKTSLNLKKGLENWYFKIDKNEKIIPEPSTHEADCLAALRYGVMGFANQQTAQQSRDWATMLP